MTKTVLILLLLLGVLGCSEKPPTQPNVILIAVEGLGFNRVLCEDEGPNTGLAMMCGESIRFTHAYTNSTTGLPNMGTLLTGRLPQHHGLRGQSQWLRSNQILVSEEALKRGYRTAFFSGGPPLMSKSGLGQGFENFDDRLALNQRPYYRSAQKVTSNFLSWLDDEISNEPFFSVLYLTDALFPFVSSTDREGELKELSVDSKFSDVSESLKDVIEELKRQKLWNQSYVILVGVQGGSNPLVLKSVQTQVALLIKPPRVQKDQATQWGVDHNVSLLDVGHTLFEIVGANPPMDEGVEAASLQSVFHKPEPKWSRDRWIHTESYWGFELFGLDIGTSVRKDHMLFVNGTTPVLYNTLTDRLESTASPISKDTEEVFELLGPPLDSQEVPSWFLLGYQFFSRGGENLNWETSSHPFSDAWRVRYYIETKRWMELAEFAVKIQRLDLEILARHKMGDTLPYIDRNSCETIFLSDKNVLSSDHIRDVCKADRLLYYLDWAKAKGTESELFYENRFRKAFQNWWSKLELGAINYANLGVLGLPLTWPQMPDISETYLVFREKKSKRFLIETKETF